MGFWNWLAGALVVLAWPPVMPAGGGAVPATLQPGAVVELQVPRALPCSRFQTVELDVDEVPGQTIDRDATAITWHAGGRDWRFGAVVWHPPPAPLRARALPRQVRIIAGSQIAKWRLSFYCRRYDLTPQDDVRRDSQPFVGVRWWCDGGHCVTDVGFPLAPGVAGSQRRLRLCAKESPQDDEACGARHRDVSPAFENQPQALALAREISADAQRTIADACRAVRGCTARASELASGLRPARWQVTEFSGLPVGMTLKAADGERGLVLKCSGRGDDVVCELELLRDGQPLLTYMPIGNRLVPEAFLAIEGGEGITMYAEPRDQKEVGSACIVRGSLVSTR